MKLHAQWITGFTDGEGCFAVTISARSTFKAGHQFKPVFTVSQHKEDSQVLYALKNYFKCGQVYQPKGDNTETEWRVQNLDHLLKHVIPFFEKHKLKTKRGIEFQRFRRLCFMLDQEVHRSSPEGFEECFQLARNLQIKFNKSVEIDKGRVQLLLENTE